MPVTLRATHCALLNLLVALALVSAATADDAAPKITFDDHVRAIFREHCLTCHNANDKKSDLALDTYSSVMAGGASGEVVLAGDIDSSRLYALVSHAEEPKMPPQQDRLADAKLDLLKKWIEGGALENSGSVAKVKKQPTMDLGSSGGAKRPDGPPPMPEGLFRQPVVYTPRTTAISALAASPWAPLAAVAGQKQISLYHTDSGQLLGVLPFPEGIPYVLKFSRSGALLLAGGGRSASLGKVVVFDVKSGKRVFEVGDELDAVLAADINPSHTQIALGGPGKIVRIFSTADGTLLHELRKHTDWIYSLEYSPDGVLLATTDRSNGLLVWEAETGREYQDLTGHGGPVTDVSWRSDSNVLASASLDGTVRLWEMENGKQVKSWPAHAGGAESVAFTHSGHIVSTGRDRLTKTWDAGGTAVGKFEGLADFGLECAFTHDGNRVLAGDATGKVVLWNTQDAKVALSLAPNPPTLEALAEAAGAKAAAAEEVLAQATAAVQQAQAAVQNLPGETVAATARARDTALRQIEEKTAALKTCDEQLTATAAAIQAATDDAARQAAAAQQTALIAEQQKLTAELQVAQVAVGPLEAALKTATEELNTARAAAEKTVAEATAAQQAAAAAADEARKARDALLAEKEAYNQAMAAAAAEAAAGSAEAPAADPQPPAEAAAAPAADAPTAAEPAASSGDPAPPTARTE